MEELGLSATTHSPRQRCRQDSRMRFGALDEAPQKAARTWMLCVRNIQLPGNAWPNEYFTHGSKL
eukprot:4521069-Amphidinium_carterae.2